MFIKFIGPIALLTLATPMFGNTPKAPQSPVPSVENAPTALRSATSQTDLDLKVQPTSSNDYVEKALPDQTISQQLAVQKSANQKLASQKENAKKIAMQKASSQKIANQKSVIKNEESEKKSVTTPALGTVTTEVEGDLTIVTARLNTSPEWKDIGIEEHGTFLQIKMPNTQIPTSGEFIDGNGPFLKKLATFQVGDSDGAIRLFLNQDASKAKLATTAELLGDRLVVTIDHKKLEQLITPPQKSATDSPSASEIIAKTTVEKDQPSPGELVAATGSIANANTPKASQPIQDLYGQLTKVAGFCGLLFIFFLAAQMIRRKRGKNTAMKSGFDAVEPATLKILSSINLGQKQRLTLVQVGTQQILLGVGQDTINMLTTIESKSKNANFATQLQMANPNAEIRLKAPEELPVVKSPRRTLSTASSATSSHAKTTSTSINIAIDDEGPRSIPNKSAKKDDDITRMLRDRLRNLPPG